MLDENDPFQTEKAVKVSPFTLIRLALMDIVQDAKAGK